VVSLGLAVAFSKGCETERDTPSISCLAQLHFTVYYGHCTYSTRYMHDTRRYLLGDRGIFTTPPEGKARSKGAVATEQYVQEHGYLGYIGIARVFIQVGGRNLPGFLDLGAVWTDNMFIEAA